MPLRLPIFASPFITVHYYAKPIKIYKNPTESICKALAKKFTKGFRGFIDNDTYIWNAIEIIHSDGQRLLNLPTSVDNIFMIVNEARKNSWEEDGDLSKWKTFSNLYVYFDNKKLTDKLIKIFPKYDTVE